MLQSTGPESLSNKEDTRMVVSRWKYISLGMGNRVDFAGGLEIGGIGMETVGIR